MAIDIQFPKSIETQADSAIMQLLPPRKPSKDKTVRLARLLEMKVKKVVDEGELFSMKSGPNLLHHFHASDSMRWCREPRRNGELEPRPLKLRDEKKLINKAEEFLSNLGMLDKEVSNVSISYGKEETADREAPSSSVITSAFVNFSYSFEGLPVVGPGAKAQVEICRSGKIQSCYRFWRNMERKNATPQIEKRPIINWGTAQKIFTLDPSFAQLNAEAKVVVEQARLCYMALPPREKQGALFPVYEMIGRVSTPEIKNAFFRRYVVAMDYTTDELKKFEITNRHIDGSCRVL